MGIKWTNPDIPEDKRAEYDQAMAEGLRLTQDAVAIAKAMLLTGKKIYADTVPEKVRASRRRKNKAARKARRNNR